MASFRVNFFPNALAREAIEAATRSNQSLRTRWDLSFKRKSQEGSGPQPKNQAKKKPRPNCGYKIPKFQQQQPAIMVPMTPPGESIQGPQGQQFVVLSPQQSPAFNPSYESTPFRSPGSSEHSRGGRGGRQRGNFRGNQRGRGRGSHHRGKGVVKGNDTK